MFPAHKAPQTFGHLPCESLVLVAREIERVGHDS